MAGAGSSRWEGCCGCVADNGVNVIPEEYSPIPQQKLSCSLDPSTLLSADYLRLMER
jgi:hypothetical protein